MFFFKKSAILWIHEKKIYTFAPSTIKKINKLHDELLAGSVRNH